MPEERMMRLAMRPPSGDESQGRDDDTRGVGGFKEFLKRHFGPNFVPPAASRLARGQGWAAEARAKSDALEARILAAEKKAGGR